LMKARVFAIVAAMLLAACFLPELKEQPAGGGETDPCLTCASEACSESYDACFDSAACSELVACAFACDASDDDCVLACTASDGAALGLDRALALAECTTTLCTDVCPALPGVGGPGGAGGAGGAGGGGATGTGTGGTGG
jgi:hypothetical protein